jgi:hypothetical protein
MTDDFERREAAISRLKNKRAFWQGLVAYVVINLFLVGVWAVTGAGYFWPIWIMAGWGMGVVLHAYSTFVQRPITEEDVDREMGRGGNAVA